MPEDSKTRITAEIGRSGLVQYGGLVHAEYDPDLRMPYAAKIYDEMRRADPTVAVGLRVIKWFIGRIAWNVQPGGETPADVEAAAFLQSCMDDMSQTWSKFIRDALTCMEFGFSWTEIVYKLRNSSDGNPPSRHDDGRIGWRKFTLLGQDSLARWEFDEMGGVQAFIQQGDLIGGQYLPERPIPISKSLLFRLDDEKNNPEGISLLRSIYLPWYCKKQIQEIEAIGIERDLTGVLIIHLPESATSADQTKAQQLLEQFKADDMSGFTAPQFGPGDHQRWRFEIINSPGQKSVDPDKAIQRYQMEIARNFLAQFLMLGQNSGSRALSSDQSDVFAVALGAIVINLEETINRFAVPPLFRLNDFGTLTALPQIKAGRVSKADSLKFAQALQALAAASLLTPNTDLERFIREEMELPALAEEEDGEQERTGQAKKQATEPDPNEDPDAFVPFQLPDPDDLEGWREIEKQADELLKKSGKRSASELFRFARPYNYAAKLNAQQTAFRSTMKGLAGQLREGQITFAKWSQLSQTAIVGNTAAGFKLGIAQAQGVPPSKVRLMPAQTKQLSPAVKEQLEYFSEFAKTVQVKVKAGEPLTSAVDARANLYGGSVRSAMEQAKVGDDPGQMLRWVRHKDDSCETCLRMEDKVKTAEAWREGGILPAQNTKCMGNCGCSLDKVVE